MYNFNACIALVIVGCLLGTVSGHSLECYDGLGCSIDALEWAAFKAMGKEKKMEMARLMNAGDWTRVEALLYPGLPKVPMLAKSIGEEIIANYINDISALLFSMVMASFEPTWPPKLKPPKEYSIKKNSKMVMVVRDSAEKTIEAIEFLLPSTVKEGL